MFTRKEALALLAEKFPENKENLYQTEVHGEFRKVIWTPEKRLEQMIDLTEPALDGLKEDGEGIPDDQASLFRRSVEFDYKNENGLWR